MKSYVGPQTVKAQVNFPYPLPTVSLELVYAIVLIKKAAALANKSIGDLTEDIADGIVATCDEILKGKHDSQFVTCSLQGGAGTSINMNVNEVIAIRATEILTKQSSPAKVHPLDHVNLHQSTNDVNPSALRIVCIQLGEKLLESVDGLISSLEKKAHQYASVRRLGRTHMQDAVPSTYGDMFATYATIVDRDKKRILEAVSYMSELNLGGTAIGNKVASSEQYISAVYDYLKKNVLLPVVPAKNMMALTSSTTDFAFLSSAIQMLSIDMSKMATDIRFLSSGPRGGIGEVHLPELQAGSSIMPGKVNPVIPESINQVYYLISGKHLSICQASADAHLELAIMFPIIADALVTELSVMITALQVLSNKCIDTLIVDEKQSLELLEKSTAYAALFLKKLGYDTVSELVKKSIDSGKTFHEVVLEHTTLTEQEFQDVLASG